MQPRDIVDRFVKLFDADDINWAHQIKVCKKLLEKYTDEQIVYALDYYKKEGAEIYSLGFLSDNMRSPVMQQSAEKHLQRSEDSGERNRKRIQQNKKTERGESYPVHLFTETGEDS